MSEYIYEHKPSGADHMGKPVELPTLVQREEIVRCRDCTFFTIDFFNGEHSGYCTLFNFGDINNMENKFCAWARAEGGRQMKLFYTFEYGEIRNCEQCPLFYDYLCCMLEDFHTTDRHGYADMLDDDNNFPDHRPDWCRLKKRKVLR